MKTNFLIFLLIIAIGCQSKVQKKDEQYDFKINQKNEKEMNNSNKQDSIKVKSLTIQEIFYQKQVEGGDLLALSNGSLKEQYKRAMIFVPAGGGNQQNKDIEVIHSSDNKIVISSSGKETIYYLYNFKNPQDGLIIQYEKNKVFKLLKYISDLNKLTEEKPTSYSLYEFDENNILEFTRNSILNKTTDIELTWNGELFE